MKQYHLCGIGNAIVDLFVEVTEEQFAALGFERGTMRLVDHAEQQTVLAKFAAVDPRLVSGGSVANSVIGFAALGGRAAFIGCVGDDRYGLHYQSELTGLHVGLGNPIVVGQPTGTCCALITPDAERTMRTCLAVSAHLSSPHVQADRHLIEQSAWLFIEGYLFSNGDAGQSAVREAIQIAKASGTKVAITCSEAFIVHVFGEHLYAALKDADLFFCNASEACAAANARDSQEAFQKLAGLVPNCVVTDGPAGAYVRWNGAEYHVPAFAVTPRDLTGAGDMFAGAFLYGVTHGVPADKAAKAANKLAAMVISQVGARLHTGAKENWRANVG